MAERSCKFCGCTEDVACRGGCAWAGPNLCTACVPVKLTPAQQKQLARIRAKAGDELYKLRKKLKLERELLEGRHVILMGDVAGRYFKRLAAAGLPQRNAGRWPIRPMPATRSARRSPR